MCADLKSGMCQLVGLGVVQFFSVMKSKMADRKYDFSLKASMTVCHLGWQVIDAFPPLTPALPMILFPYLSSCHTSFFSRVFHFISPQIPPHCVELLFRGVNLWATLYASSVVLLLDIIVYDVQRREMRYIGAARGPNFHTRGIAHAPTTLACIACTPRATNGKRIYQLIPIVCSVSWEHSRRKPYRGLIMIMTRRHLVKDCSTYLAVLTSLYMYVLRGLITRSLI